MNKKLKVFLKIVYYFFTFGIGILLAVTLPNAYFYKNVPEQIEKYVQAKQYARLGRQLGCKQKELSLVLRPHVKNR